MAVGEQGKTMDETTAKLEALVEAQPRDIEAHLRLARRLGDEQQLPRAGHHNLTAARLLAASGRISEAIEVCQKALMQRPGDSETALLLANLYARRPGEGHAQRIIEVVDAPKPTPLAAEPLILLTPSDAVEELASDEVDDLSRDVEEVPGEELDPLEDLEEIDELEASRIESLDTTERELLKWEEFNTTQISLAEVARRRAQQLAQGAPRHRSDEELLALQADAPGDDTPTQPRPEEEPDTTEHKPLSLSELARRRREHIQAPATQADAPASAPRTTPATPEALRAPETEPATPGALQRAFAYTTQEAQEGQEAQEAQALPGQEEPGQEEPGQEEPVQAPEVGSDALAPEPDEEEEEPLAEAVEPAAQGEEEEASEEEASEEEASGEEGEAQEGQVRELSIAALDSSEVTTAEYGEVEERAIASLEEVLSSAEENPRLDPTSGSMQALPPLVPFGDDMTPLPNVAPLAVDDNVEAQGDEELELHQDEIDALETREFQAITPQDVLEVIDASDDTFLKGRDSMVFSSGASRMAALSEDSASVPGQPSHAELESQAGGEDGFDAIADLIQHSLDASLDHIEDTTSEFHGVSRVDMSINQEPPVPGWSRQGKYTRPPEAGSEPPLPVQEHSAPWSPRALQEALGEEDEDSQDQVPAAGLRLQGTARELLERLDPEPSQRLRRWLRRRRFAPGAIILREGVPHHSLFLIERGSVYFERRVATGRQKVATMEAGGVFGEFELLLGRAPRAQVRAGEETVLLELTERALQDLSITAHNLWGELWRFYQERLVLSFLENSSLFTALSPAQRKELAASFEEQTRNSGETLIRQGEPGTGMYLISSGEVMVSHQQQERRTVVANLREGNFFCSLAQSSHEPIAASVEVRDEARLMVLPREVLLEQLRQHHSIREALGRLVSYRQIVVGKTNYSRIGVPG